jgi:hypothetical protein
MSPIPPVDVPVPMDYEYYYTSNDDDSDAMDCEPSDDSEGAQSGRWPTKFSDWAQKRTGV